MTIELAQAAAFFDSLKIILPHDSILFFEGTSIAPEVEAFYSQHRAPTPVAVARDSPFSFSKTFHVRFSPEVCEKLKEFSARLDPLRLFDHLKGYREECLLFWFHDGFDNVLLISEHVPKSAIDEFCAALNVTADELETTPRAKSGVTAILSKILGR